MELGGCANLLRLSLEGFRQREESSVAKPACAAVVAERTLLRTLHVRRFRDQASWPKFAELRQCELRGTRGTSRLVYKEGAGNARRGKEPRNVALPRSHPSQRR
jgi:hypothetical protein